MNILSKILTLILLFTFLPTVSNFLSHNHHGFVLEAAEPQKSKRELKREARQNRGKIPILSTYDRDEIAWSLGYGTSTITGSGFLRRVNGELVLCAGNEVEFYPVGTYSTERITKLYGNAYKGHNDKYTRRRITDSDFQYQQDKKSTYCGVDGKFTIQNIPAGEYFVITQVVWQVGTSFSDTLFPEGGNIMTRVKVNEGQTVNVVLTY